MCRSKDVRLRSRPAHEQPQQHDSISSAPSQISGYVCHATARDRGVFPIELSFAGADEVRRSGGGALADGNLGTQAGLAHRADEDDR